MHKDAYVENVVNLTWFVDEKKGYPINYNRRIKLNDMVIVNTSFEAFSLEYPMLRGVGEFKQS